MLSCGELWALRLYLETFGIFAGIMGQKFDKILKFFKVAKSDIFEIPDHARLLRIDFLIPKLDFGALKVDFSAFSEN